MTPDGLDQLEDRLAQDLSFLCYPPENWVAPRSSADGAVSDAIIIGGGMCGMVAWFALNRAGIRNIRILDRNPHGYEGPWDTYARMETLRSPKQLVGPASGHASMTFQAWYRARFGAEAWDRLDKIPRRMWMDYLRWFRKVLGIPIENGVSMTKVEPHGDLLRLTVTGEVQGTILTRRLIMATGRDGTGAPAVPDFVKDLDSSLWSHSSDDIDFAALRGQRVAVIGVGASAVDNAAEALEAGAAEVRHLIRRQRMPTVNKMMGIGSYGFVAGFAQMPDAWRWRFMQYSFATQTPPPRGSTLRVSRHANAFFHFGKAVQSVARRDDGIRIRFADGTALDTDYLILGTGFTVDPLSRTEFGPVAKQILLWRDVFTPPEDEPSRDLGLFPYLNQDFSLREKVPGSAPWLSRVLCFNYGSTISLGKVSGDIPAVSEGGVWLARTLAASLYNEDIDAHWQALQAYDTPELTGDEWIASDLHATAPVLEPSR